MANLWALVKLAPKLALFIKTAKPFARAAYERYKAGGAHGADEDMRIRLLESRIDRLEASVAEAEKTIRRLTTAVFLLTGVAIAALLLAVVKLA
jgi:hypothetical protein